MAMIRYATREITAKLVYYGPGLSGKTTNLVEINRLRPGGRVGDMISLATEGDRTLYFDLLPINIGTIAGFRVRFQLFTVPGQTHYNKTRKEVLREADGVVFVADSQPARREANIESLANLRSNLAEAGLDFDTMPFVLQFNKRDVKDALPIELLRQDLACGEVEHFEAVAVQAVGVVETLSAATRRVLESLDARYNVYSKHEPAAASASVPASAAVSAPAPTAVPAKAPPVRATAVASPRRTVPPAEPPAVSPPERPTPTPARRPTAVAVPRGDGPGLGELRRLLLEDREHHEQDKREILDALDETRAAVEALLAIERRRHN